MNKNVSLTIFFLCRKQVQASRTDAEKDGVVVPTTMEEYCMKAKPLRPAQDSIEMDDFYDDDCYDIDDMDDDSEGILTTFFNQIVSQFL